MTQRKNGSAAPVKQKLRKDHGPKRHLHAGFKPMVWQFSQCSGLLNKYNNYESFCIACNDRGVKTNLKELWNMYFLCGTTAGKDAFLRDIKNHNAEVVQKMLKKSKK